MHDDTLLGLWNGTGFHSSFFVVHYWSAFWTVVLLGVIQILLAYYNSHITIEALPDSVSPAKRRRYRTVFSVMVVGITLLTLLLARLNDSNQYRSERVAEQERVKQEALENKLEETFSAIHQSEEQLSIIRKAVMKHPPDRKRDSMLESIEDVQRRLGKQAGMMPQIEAEQQRDKVALPKEEDATAPR